MEVTNNSDAPQGVHTLGGIAYVMPGETRELDLNSEHVTRAARIEGLALKGKASKGEMVTATDTIEIPDNEVDQLRQKLETSTADVARLTAQIADRDTEIASLKQTAEVSSSADEISKLTATVSDKDKEIEGLQATITDLNAQIEKLNASVANAGQQQTTEQNQQPAAVPVGPFEVREGNQGWFGIFGADGAQVGKNVRAADAEAFRAMTPEDQLAYLTAPSAPAGQ